MGLDKTLYEAFYVRFLLRRLGRWAEGGFVLETRGWVALGGKGLLFL